MKKNRLLTLMLVPISCLFLWAGCGPDDRSRQEGYHFGIDYDFTRYLFRAEHDEQEENFIFYYTAVDSTYDYAFCFGFTGESYDYYYNSAEFEYTDDSGNEIVFEESGFYYFSGDKTIYISYKNANEEIKASIADNRFDVETSGCVLFPY